MSTNDYVKFMTQQIVSYMDQPKEARKQSKEQRKLEREPIGNHWFGVLPLAVSLMLKRQK